jgi:hypothetical protein
MKLHVIVTAFHRELPLKRLICDFLLQTNTNWQMYIVHDGPAKKNLVDMVASFGDPRVGITITRQVNGYWGHPNRAMMLDRLPENEQDYVLITNDDNQYLQNMVQVFQSCFHPLVGMVYCHMLHNYFNYDILRTKVRVGAIDMGSFIVRLDVAKKVGFTTYVETADGVYAEECARECNRQKLAVKEIAKIMFIHN